MEGTTTSGPRARHRAGFAVGVCLAIAAACSVSEPTITLEPAASGGDDATTAGSVGSSGKGAGGSSVSTGGSASGGDPAAGASTGGTATGGTARGGNATGGTAAGGTAAGGTAAGGNATGGTAAGGNADAGVLNMPGGAGGSPPTNPCDGSDPVTCLNLVASKAGDFGNALKSSWFLEGCQQLAGHDCINGSTCPNQSAPNVEDVGATTIETFPIGGDSGQSYKLTFKFNGIAQGRYYTGGTRDAAAAVPADVHAGGLVDGFYRDGTSPFSHYDVWKVTVFDEGDQPVRHYYMNSFPDVTYESHELFLLSYTKSIVVVGGGKVQFLVQDSNCHAINNCNAGFVDDTSCVAPRLLPNEPTAVLPPMYPDPITHLATTPLLLNKAYGSAAQPWHSNIGHFTVTAVVETSDGPLKDYK